MFQYSLGVLGKAPAAVTDTLPVPEPELPAPSRAQPQAEVAGASGGEMDDMKRRLEALRS